MPAAKQRFGAEGGRRIGGCDEARQPVEPSAGWRPSQ